MNKRQRKKHQTVDPNKTPIAVPAFEIQGKLEEGTNVVGFMSKLDDALRPQGLAVSGRCGEKTFSFVVTRKASFPSASDRDHVDGFLMACKDVTEYTVGETTMHSIGDP